MPSITVPDGYKSALNLHDSQVAIKRVKDFFQEQLATQLNLLRVTAPLFVSPESGLNDNLNGVERPVSFDVLEMNGRELEVVHSLAKWKRMALGRYGFEVGEGLYTDMNAIRRDEDTDNIHSIYVDQWDWEKVITRQQRNVATLKETVKSVYEALRVTEKFASNKYKYIKTILPEEIIFITSQELLDMYPDKDAKEREKLYVKEHKAAFIMQIGDVLSDGTKHDGRAPDYDDWKLNGDIIVYYPLLDIALELSSMGIRVDEKSLKEQLEKAGCPERAELSFQKSVLENTIPLSVGGGIGQSRICMFFLRKCHIGEVQVSMWTQEELDYAKEHGVTIL